MTGNYVTVLLILFAASVAMGGIYKIIDMGGIYKITGHPFVQNFTKGAS